MEVSFDADKAALDKITKEIGDIAYKAPTILKDAANATGKEAVRAIKEGLAKRYDFTGEDRPENSLKRKSATYANPRTIISASGPMHGIEDFRAGPFRLTSKRRSRPVIRGRVLRSSGIRTLRKYGNNAFVVRFDSGHMAVVVRNPQKRYENQQKLAKRAQAGLDTSKIEVIDSPNAASMAGKAFEERQDDIGEMLQKNMAKYIARFNEGRGTV